MYMIGLCVCGDTYNTIIHVYDWFVCVCVCVRRVLEKKTMFHFIPLVSL